jgi:hypothetical protein
MSTLLLFDQHVFSLHLALRDILLSVYRKTTGE